MYVYQESTPLKVSGSMRDKENQEECVEQEVQPAILWQDVV